MQLQQPQKEGGSVNVCKPGKYEIPSFFYCIIRTVSGRKGCASFFVEPKVYFQEEDSCFSQIDSPAVPLTVFTASLAPLT